MITSLTSAQKAKFPEYIKRWIDLALSTDRPDKAFCESEIKRIAKLCKLREPTIIWVGDPLSQCLTKLVLDRLGAKKPGTTSNAVVFPMNSAVSSAVNSAVSSAVDSAVRSTVASAVYAAVASAVSSAVNSAVRPAVDSAVYYAVNSAVYSAVRSAVYSAVASAVSSAVNSAVDSAVNSAVDSAVNSAVYSAVRSAVDSAVYSAVNSAVYSAVDSAVGSEVYSAVGSEVSSAVESAAAVSFKTGWYKAWTMAWAGWCAWYRFMADELGVRLPDGECISGLVQHLDSFLLADGIALAVPKHTKLHLDSRGRLHNPKGKAIEYETGWGIYAIHGVRVPDWVINDPEKITPESIEREINAEVRRVLLDLYGIDRYFADSHAKLIHKDRFGELYHRKYKDDDIIAFVKVLNSTPEPDGSRKPYFLFTDQRCKTARAAVALSFGLTPQEYNPEVET